MTQHREGCLACGAVLQEVQIDGEKRLRCPWASDDVYQAVELGRTLIYCNWPLNGKRIPGGIQREAVK